MLEKNRQKKRAIGTLDVAFKKRFFELRDANNGEGVDDEHDGYHGDNGDMHKRHHSKKGKGKFLCRQKGTLLGKLTSVVFIPRNACFGPEDRHEKGDDEGL